MQKYWEITRTKRLKDILSLNSKGAIQPSDYMKSFPALKNPSGYILVSIIQLNNIIKFNDF